MEIYIKKGDGLFKHGLWKEWSILFICLFIAFCLRLGELRRIKGQPLDPDVGNNETFYRNGILLCPVWDA
jgi:hypothetical protein